MKIEDILTSARGSAFGTPRFLAWLAFILKWECEFERDGVTIRAENDPDDAGGLTFAGIDARSHREFNFRNPRPEFVVTVYHNDYWRPSQAAALAWPVGEVVANFAVNMGLGRAARLLQTAINALPGRGQTLVDGRIGVATIAAANMEDARMLADVIEDLADETYRGIVRANPRNMKFLNGWLNRNAALERWWMGLEKRGGTK